MAVIVAASGGGNWTTATTWVGGVVPTTTDDVQLNATSGPVTLDTSSAVRSLDCTGYTSTFTHPSAKILQLGDGTAGASNILLKFVSGMTYTLGNAASSSITFGSTAATQQTIDFGGKTTGNITQNGSKGQFVSAHSTSSSAIVTLNSGGTLDTNGQTCSWGQFYNNNNGTRVLTMGSSSITITGTGTSWNVAGLVTNFTITTNTATITLTGSGATFAGGTRNYNGTSIVLSGSGAMTVSGSNTLGAFARTGTATKLDSLLVVAPQTVVRGITLTGDSPTNRLLVQSNVLGTSRLLSGSSVVAANVDFMDIAGGGTASWNLSAITGGSGDCGGNTSITFTTSATQNCTMSVSKNWSDVTIWTSRVPLPQDDTTFTGVTGGTLTADMPRLCRTMDWTGATGTPQLLFNTVNNIYGSIVLIAGMTTGKSGDPTMSLSGRGNYTITSAGKSWAYFSINAVNGTYSLVDALVSGATNGSMAVNSGTFNDNGQNVTLSQSNYGFGSSGTLNLTGNWQISSGYSTVFAISGGVFNASGTLYISGNSDSPFTISGGTINASSFVISLGSSTTTRTFRGNSNVFGGLTYNVAGSTGSLYINGSNTFNTFNFSDANNGRNVRFQQGTTTTVTNWNVFGTAGKNMIVSSQLGGSQYTLTKASGVVSSDYLTLQDSNATGGATWYAGANSTSTSNNTGWIFSAPVTSQNKFFAMFT